MAEPVPQAIERTLRALSDRLAFPETPPLAASVTSRLLVERAVSPARRPFAGIALWTRRRTLVLAVVGLMLIAGAAVAGRLAIGAVGIRVLPAPPTATPTLTEASLGRPVSLDEAAGLLGFEPAYPPSLGTPDDVRVADVWSGERVVVLAWRPPSDEAGIPGTPWRALLMQLPGEDELAFKEVLSGGAVEHARVSGAPALWIAGTHELVLLTPDGEQRLSVAANTLVWQRDGVTYRLETRLSKPDARALAETVS